jgi:hypothetical protein
MNPAASSISATEIPISTETVDATRTVPARSAATAMSLMLLYLLRVVSRQLVEAIGSEERLGGSLTPLKQPAS